MWDICPAHLLNGRADERPPKNRIAEILSIIEELFRAG